MICRRVERSLSCYLEGRLSVLEASAVTAHLERCPDCRRRREEFAADGAALRSLAALSAPPGLERRAVEGWKTERSQAVPAGANRVLLATSPQADCGRPLVGTGRKPGPTADRKVGGHREGSGFSPTAPDRRLSIGLSLGAAALVLSGLGLAFLQRDLHPAPKPSLQGPSLPAVDRMAKAMPLPRPWQGSHIGSPGTSSGAASWTVPGGHRPHGRVLPSERRMKEGRRHAAPSPRLGSAARLVDDLRVLNGSPLQEASEWVALRSEEWERIEARVRRQVRVKDDFVTLPFPRLASTAPRQIAAAAENYQREAAIVDARLAREVTVATKATALSDLCEQLRTETGIQLVAGNSVADEKVTLFCEKLPLREVMRQLSRPFGYTWLRSGKPGEYHYELVQDLKSQLLEEELRNRDRNAALLALEQEMSRYRRFLELSPDEALARARSAAPEEKKLLENLSSWGWGPIHMYFRLSPRDLATLRSGQKLTFGIEGQIAEKLPGLVGGAGEQPLPSELRRGVLQSLRDRHVVMRDGRYWNAPADDPGGVPLTTVPEARPIVTLDLHQSELGQFTLDGHSGFAIVNTNAVGKVTMGLAGQGPYASGWSPVVLQPDNREANAKLAGDPTLHARISIALDARRQAPGASEAEPAGAPAGTRAWRLASSASRVTTADVLEAIHQATGRPVVGDFYTRLYKPETASVRNQPLFDALNQIADAMHLRWSKDGTWLQFRSSGYYNDRLKEVPNRFLARWAAARRQRGVLTLDELLEIAQLSDAQLDATEMAEGARDCWGLAEWNLPRGGFQRPHLRYLAQLISAQRQEAMGPAGLPFMRMSLMQQQQFIAMISSMSMGPPPLQSLDEVAGASLRVAYTRPGEFQVQVPAAPGGREREPVELALVREPTRVAALQAAHRFNPDVEPGEIVPTELAVTILYTLGSPRTKRTSIAVRATPGSSMGW